MMPALYPHSPRFALPWGDIWAGLEVLSAPLIGPERVGKRVEETLRACGQKV